MGGPGSGRPYGAGLLRDKCHEFHSIDLAWMKRRGCLEIGRCGGLTWSRGGVKTGSIQYRVEPDGLRLVYRTRPAGGEWSDVNELIPFVYTVMNFSGQRMWFSCPTCKCRCRIIYGGRRFLCRLCHDLRYETQYEPAFARAASRALRFRERLGGQGGIADPFPEKPKGMHWKTYHRLRELDRDLCNQWAAGLMQKWKIGGERGEIW